jgi:uncharacterized protein (UPF0335 family)
MDERVLQDLTKFGDLVSSCRERIKFLQSRLSLLDEEKTTIRKEISDIQNELAKVRGFSRKGSVNKNKRARPGTVSLANEFLEKNSATMDEILDFLRKKNALMPSSGQMISKEIKLGRFIEGANGKIRLPKKIGITGKERA